MDINEYLKKYERIFEIRISEYSTKIAEKWGYLPYMIERYNELFGNGLFDFLRSCEVPLPRSIRCNDLKIDCEKLVNRLDEKGFKLEKIYWLKHGYKVISKPKSPTLGATIEYLLGFYHIQGISSMIPPYLLEPKQGELILDLAAAPGSKTTQLSQLMRNEGIVIAVEKNPKRIRSLISNINRLGCKNVIVVLDDATGLKLGTSVDKILLDAPCSGEGIIMFDRSRKTKTPITKLRDFSSLQLKLLKNAYNLLKDDGLLVYSTCSIAPEENELVVNYAIEELGMEVVKVNWFPHENGIEEYFNIKFSPSVKNCSRMYPHIHGTEGFFICLLKK
ncbi:MAG: RsmB/NOP family class I SAM-dependent RNA methyltransferase [Sulfolobaceae archaeon]